MTQEEIYRASIPTKWPIAICTVEHHTDRSIKCTMYKDIAGFYFNGDVERYENSKVCMTALKHHLHKLFMAVKA